MRAYFLAVVVLGLVVYVTVHLGSRRDFASSLGGRKAILLWTYFYDRQDFYVGLGTAPFEGCPVSDCYTTADRSLMEHDLFDAVVFHGQQYRVLRDGMPKNRQVSQRYVFFMMEPPTVHKIDINTPNRFYNLTMTYLRDSDVYYPYGRLVRAEKPYSPPTKESLAKRKGFAAWVVSNCKTPSKREGYVTKLQAHLNVSIYGNCGSLSCKDDQDCMRAVADNHLFYLSFENSLCEDYVTEKLFNTLKMDVVPVVMGGADYSAFAPPNSIIDARKMSPVKLAKALKSIAADYDQYVAYFEWKSKFVVDMDSKHGWCSLCKTLHSKRTSIYKNIIRWYVGYKRSERCNKGH